METFPVISELNEGQKGHMAFLLDTHTYCGYFTAGRIMRYEIEEYNNMPINKIFESFDITSNKATRLSKKVLKFPGLSQSNDLPERTRKLMEMIVNSSHNQAQHKRKMP